MKAVVVGAGQIADAHIGEIQKIPGAKVAGLCDLSASPLTALADKFGIPDTSTDLGELLERVKPDVVHITTPPASHLPIALQCLRAGAHVYIEKPITVNAEEAQTLLDEAERLERFVCMGVNRVFESQQQQAFATIRSGDAGRLSHIDALFTYDLSGPFGKQVLANPSHWIATLPGQVIQNNINHPLGAIVPFLSDDYTVSVWAGDWSENGIVLDELRVTVVDATNKLTANILFSSSIRPAAFRVTYYGSKRTMQLNLVNKSLVEETPPTLPGTLGNLFALRAASKSLGRQFRRGLWRFVTGKRTFFSDMGDMFRAFYTGIENGSGPPVTYDEVLRTCRLVDEIVEAMPTPEGRSAEGEGRT